jgi:hypothetical protein
VVNELGSGAERSSAIMVRWPSRGDPGSFAATP